MNQLRVVVLAVLVLLSAASAQTTSPSADDKLSTTEHQVTIGEQAIRYRATAGTILMRDEAGKAKATVFHVAYDKIVNGATRPADRPVTFVFNGGPGAASVWLHLGTAGPRRIDLNGDGEAPAPPHRLVDNAHSWLDATDLVFIDPVGTGYSRPAPGEKGEEFYGVKEDIAWVGEFIRLYLTRNQRWDSPKFLAGESYGTTRAAGLSEHLADRHGIDLNGIILVSTVLDFATLNPGRGNDLPSALYLPTSAAIMHHHRKLSGDLRALLSEVQKWATSEYLVALAQGDGLDESQRKAVAARLAQYTGLKEEWILKADLRISPEAFRQQLLGDQRKLIGRFDGRIVGQDLRPTSGEAEYDPSLSRYLPVYAGTFNAYVRRELKFSSDLPYEVLSPKVHPWNFGRGGGHLYVGDELKSAMAKNPHMKVLVASGWHDLATPYFASDHTIAQLRLPGPLRQNVRQTYYAGGHMMYHLPQALAQLHKDVAEFVRWATGK